MKKSLARRFINLVSPFDKIKIQAYRGYGNRHAFFLKGRVLEDEGILQEATDGKFLNFIHALKRFESDEISSAGIELFIGDNHFRERTDQEGYFSWDTSWTHPVSEEGRRWISGPLRMTELRNDGEEIRSVAEVLIPSENSDYGIITDIDDTVLQTHVTSRYQWRMFYDTFFKNSHQRLPMEGVVELLRKFEKGANGKRENPVFYVSHSPWNLYGMIEKFMAVQQFPKGPILLRDYGIKPSGSYADHKITSISHILSMYPDKPFILLGDSAERDADIYLEAAAMFPGRIKAIYIRLVKDNANARRVAHLLAKQKDAPARLVETSGEIFDHSRKDGLLI